MYTTQTFIRLCNQTLSHNELANMSNSYNSTEFKTVTGATSNPFKTENNETNNRF